MCNVQAKLCLVFLRGENSISALSQYRKMKIQIAKHSVQGTPYIVANIVQSGTYIVLQPVGGNLLPGPMLTLRGEFKSNLNQNTKMLVACPLSYYNAYFCIDRICICQKQPHICLQHFCSILLILVCIGLYCAVTGAFPAHMSSNAENISMWWRYHVQCRGTGSNVILLPLILEWHWGKSAAKIGHRWKLTLPLCKDAITHYWLGLPLLVEEAPAFW